MNNFDITTFAETVEAMNSATIPVNATEAEIEAWLELEDFEEEYDE